MFKDNLIQLRKLRQMTQEEVAEKVGVTRQAVAKWESGDTVPDLDRCRTLAELFGVSLDDLKPGIWNVYPVYKGDHMSLQGGLLHKKDIRSFYTDMLTMIGDAD